MKYILIFALSLCIAVHAQAAWVKPLPREFTANEHCQPYQLFETEQAQIRIGWCHTDDTPPPGMWMWRLYVWQACLKSKCNTVPAGFSLVGAIDAARAASDPVGAIATLSRQLRIPVAPGSAEEAHLLTVYSRACKAMTAPPYPGAPPQGWMPGWVFAADFCPNEPAAPPPSTVQYITTVTNAYPLNADGTRSITRWLQPAIVGEPADGSIKILQFGATFCKVTRLSTAQTTVVAGCRVKP